MNTKEMVTRVGITFGLLVAGATAGAAVEKQAQARYEGGLNKSTTTLVATPTLTNEQFFKQETKLPKTIILNPMNSNGRP